jgi:autoinducer 2 (AI-2) kinase
MGYSPAPASPFTDVREEILNVLGEMYDLRLITATGGNISARVSGAPDALWITPGGVFKGSLRADSMVRINLQGEPLDKDALPSSSERLVHTEILRRRPDLSAVVHTHAPWATLLAFTETPFLPVCSEAAYIGELPRVPFIMPGTLDLGVAVAAALGDKGVAVLMQNHGLVVAGSTLRRAANVTAVIERYSELILRCLMLGKQPPVIPDDIASALRAKGEMMA